MSLLQIHGTLKQLPNHGSWLAMRKAAQSHGGLPPHPLLDHLCTHKGELHGELWTRHLLVYPPKEGRFKPGEDFTDTANGVTFVFPAETIPKEAFTLPKTGLFVDPVVYQATPDKTIPKSTRVPLARQWVNCRPTWEVFFE